MRLLAIAAFLFVSAWANVALAAQPRLPVPKTETLPNGLQIVWFLSDHLPVLDFSLMIKSGYRDDPAGKSGTAELLSSLLDRGAAGMSAEQFARAIEVLGASRYTNADDDTFTVGIHGLAPDADVLLDLIAKMALQPNFETTEVQREQARLLDRWSHLADYSEALVALAYHRVLTSGTSYGRGSLFSLAEFKKITRANVVDFHKKHFTPKNAILMVVGRANPTELRPKILAKFGAWTGDTPKREHRVYQSPRLTGKQILVVGRPGLNQAQVRIGFPAPPLNSPDHYPLVVGNALLGEYFQSRLNALVRDQLGLTYGIGSSFSYSKEFAAFTVSSATRNESVGPLLVKTIEVLQALKTGGATGEEVETSKKYLQGSFPLGTSTLGLIASRWLAGYVFEMGPDYLNEFLPRVESVNVREVNAAFARYLKLDQMVITVAGDPQAVQKSLAASELGKSWRIKPVSVKDLQ